MDTKVMQVTLEKTKLLYHRQCKVLATKHLHKVQSSSQVLTTNRNKVIFLTLVFPELGPRMELKLLKIEEGFCEGHVLWNKNGGCLEILQIFII